jgi:hypothetical protein
MSIDTLRKFCCGLALLLIVASIVMTIPTKDFRDPKLPGGMKNAGIAMELVSTTEEVQGLANNTHNQQTLYLMQQWDEWFFIPAYVLFYGAGGIFAFQAQRQSWTRWFGAAILVLVACAAVFDYLEDQAIYRALADLDHANAADISGVSYVKWGLLYAMLACYVPLFLRRWHSATLRILGLPFALYAGFSGVTGVLSCFAGARQQVESTTLALAAPVIFFMPFVALFHQSAMDGLNWLGNLPLLKILISWPEIKEPPGKAAANPHTGVKKACNDYYS